MSNYILKIRRYLRLEKAQADGGDIGLAAADCLVLYISFQLLHGRGLVAAVLSLTFLISQLESSKRAGVFFACAAGLAAVLAYNSGQIVVAELLFSSLFLCLTLAVVFLCKINPRALVALFVFVNVMPFVTNCVLGDFTSAAHIETRLSLIEYIDSGTIPWALPASLPLTLFIPRRKEPDI